MKCCVSFCVNNSEIIPDSQNVTFHRMPTEKIRRAAWVQALGIEEKNMQRLRGPFICSLHFREGDFYTTKGGQRAVQRGAVPRTEQICIICLDTGRRLFSLNYYNLEEPYENVTGISLSKLSFILSPRVCWECGQRLLNCNMFRQKSVRAQQILMKLAQQDEVLRMQTIKTVNRKKHKLKSNITKEIFEPDYYDFHWVHDENNKNVKSENREGKKNIKVKIEKVVYGSESKAEVKNEAEKVTIVYEPKKEGAAMAATKDVTIDDEFLLDDIDNDEFLNGSIDKVKRKTKENSDKCTKIDSSKNVKLFNEAIEVDVEFLNNDIDCNMDCVNENTDDVTKNDSYVNLPDQNVDIDMDFPIDNGDEDVNFMTTNVTNVNLPDANDVIDFEFPVKNDSNDKLMNKNTNLPDDDYDIDLDDDIDTNNDMDLSDKNDSDVELIDTTAKSENSKKCANKTKVKLKKKSALSGNKTKVTLSRSKVKSEDKDSTAKVKKRSRKRKTEFQGHYLRRKAPTGGMELFKVSVLTYEEQVADIQSKKDTPLYKNSTYKCTYCFKGYQFEDAYEAHMEQHTDKYGEFECAICGIHTSSRQKLLHHLNMTHVVRYSCTLCPFYTRHRNTAKSHGRWHNGTKTKCPHCDDVEFSKLTSLMSHIRKKHPSDCVCALCGFSFIGERGLALHLKMKHQFDDTQVSVDGCRVVSCRSKLTSLMSHIRKKHPSDCVCALCGFSFIGERGLALHLKMKHQFDDTQVSVDGCRVVSCRSKLTSLMSHIRKKHPSDCVCALCGFSFIGERGLALHLKMKHQFDDTQGELSGPLCAECNIRFASQTAYEQHLAVSLRHTTEDKLQRNEPTRRKLKGPPRRRGELTVTCEQCGAKLKGFKHYTYHFKRQHRDKIRTQFANAHERCLCEQCGRVFQHSSALKSHMLVHAGKKDVRCTVCDKRFYYQRQLTIHMDIHNEPKRTFDCPVCARSFTSQSNKNRHLWTHTQVSRPFKCHACPKTFVYPSERKIHINHAHANQPYPKKSKNRVRNSRPKFVKEVPYGQIGLQSGINEASYSSETSVILN